METLSDPASTQPMDSTLTLIAAVGAGLVAGVFFAFSTFVMTALRRLPEAQGLAAMQEINLTAPLPPLMSAMFGTAMVCLGVGATALTRLDELVARYRLAGAILYLAGIVLTMTYHVPRNNELATGAGPGWPVYASRWTAWNHARTVAFLAAAACLGTALHVA
jgi:uncharacterized membrane protein